MRYLMAITLVLCCLMLQASAGDYALQIFGNANLDENIDEQDLAYLQGIINGQEKATELADADNNRRIDESDIAQVERIINGTQTEITVIDASNKTVTVKQPLERIVIYNHQCAEILQLLECQDLVVGVRNTFVEQPNRFSEMSQVQNIGSGGEPDVEAVLKTSPDAILGYTTYPSEEALDKKLTPEITVLRFECDCSGAGPDDMRKNVKTLGYLLGAREKADQYLKWHDRYLSLVEDRIAEVPEEKRVKVYLETGPGADKPSTSRTAIGNGHDANNLVEMAGGINLAAGHVPRDEENSMEYGEIEIEWILTQNPEIIVGRAMNRVIRPYENENDSLIQEYYREIKSLPGFNNVSAVKNNRVYIITNDYTGAPSYPSALMLLAKWFYPDIFADIDPQASLQEYVDMMGLDFDVKEKGTFFYPGL